MPDSHGQKPLHWYEEPQVKLRSHPAGVYSDTCSDGRKATLHTVGSAAHTISVVGDPFMPESKWLAACALAQDVPLIKEQSKSQRALSGFGTLFSSCSLFLAMFFCYPISMFVGGELVCLLTNIEPNVYLRQLATGDYVGFFLCLIWFAGFLISFLLQSKRLKVLATGISFLALLVVGAAFGYSYLGPLGLLLGPISGLGAIALNYVASTIRDALPKNFSAQKVIKSTLRFTLLPAMFVAYSIWHVASGDYSSNGGYSPASAGALAFYIAALIYCAGLSGFAIARASKSKSFKACASLAAILQAPLLMGLLFATTVAVCAAAGLHAAATSPDHYEIGTIAAWKEFGLLKVIGLFMSAPVTFMLAICGAYGGVKANRANAK